MNNRKNGYSLIELMSVMMLLVLFGLTTFTLVVSGSNTYNRLTDSKNENAELRVAISYIKMEVRQNDIVDSICIRKSFASNGDALVISKTIDKDIYEKWIYCYHGSLKEAYVKKGTLPNDNLGMEIAKISDFKIAMVNNDEGISIKVSKAFGNGSKSYSSVIALNAYQQGGVIK